MQFPLAGRLEDAETGEVLIDRLYAAESFWQRFRGLQLMPELEPDTGLLLRKCRSVHTMWMRFSIDLYFLSEDFRIMEARVGVKPWRVVMPRAKSVAHVIEVASRNQEPWIEGKQTRIEKHPISPITASDTNA